MQGLAILENRIPARRRVRSRGCTKARGCIKLKPRTNWSYRMKQTITQQEFDSMPMLIGIPEASRLSGLHPHTLHLKARNGEIPAKKVGRRWLFNKQRLAEYLGL